jgi:hypothetical protein
MSDRTLNIWAAELSQYEAQHTLVLLDVATFTSWTGETPRQAATTPEQRAMQKAHDEGNQARRDYRERLLRRAYGQSLVAENPDAMTLNKHGDAIDAKGRIHARNGAHIMEILSRPRT